MSDLVERLRSQGNVSLLIEAADRIEWQAASIADHEKNNNNLCDEIERLRECLRVREEISGDLRGQVESLTTESRLNYDERCRLQEEINGRDAEISTLHQETRLKDKQIKALSAENSKLMAAIINIANWSTLDPEGLNGSDAVYMQDEAKAALTASGKQEPVVTEYRDGTVEVDYPADSSQSVEKATYSEKDGLQFTDARQQEQNK